MEENDEVIEGIVAKLSDLKDGEMKDYDLGEGKVLLVKDKGQVSAFSHKCTHFGAPLKNGVYANGHIRCPWHGACFSASSGDIEDFPGMDSLHKYTVNLEDQNGEQVIKVKANKKDLKAAKRTKKMCPRSTEDTRVFVIIGGGPAGGTCAETLRQEGFTGRIVMINKEKFLPYDRTKLSKALSTTADKVLLRPESFFSDAGIETILGKEVIELDAERKVVKLNDGTEIKYDSALIATGGIPRTLPVPGMQLGNIFQLRESQDATGINENCEGKNVVIVGSSFIGMEAAAAIAKRAASVVVIGMEKVPFERVLGERVGTALQKLHETNNIQFRMQRVVKEFKGEAKVSAVVLDNGDVLPADMCIIGAGIIPATKFIKPGPVKIERDGSVVVDMHLKAADGLYAAGDLARYPYFLYSPSELVRVEHYGMAQYQGKTAAMNMLGKEQSVKSVPFFWTVHYGKSIRYCGHAVSYDDVIFNGNPEDYNFIGYYLRQKKVVAAISLGRDPVCSAIAELLAADKMPSLDELKSGIDIVKLVKENPHF